MTLSEAADSGAPQRLLDCARTLSRLALALTADGAGRVRAEDALALLAAVVGERVLEAAGEIDVRAHGHVPGQRLLSERVNALLAGPGKVGGHGELPPDSVFGLLLASLGEGYGRDAFPDLDAVFRGFVERIGEDDDWGGVPLSVAAEHRPRLLPIQAAYQTRAEVDVILSPLGDDRRDKLHAATLALALLLRQTRTALPQRTALLLVCELVNGMAKTAPLTAAAVARYEAARSARRQ